MKIADKMKLLAEHGHAGRFRKDGKTPYIEHPRAVVALLVKWGVTDEPTLAVAWGHDLLEDTDVTEDEIRLVGGRRHGQAILADIQALTRDKTVWPNKKAWLREVARTASPRALLVKAADRICNTRDFIALGDVAKARDYLAEAAPVFALAPETETIAKELETVRAEIDEAEAASPVAAPETGITELYFVLDRSGSMGHLVRSTIDGFNEMLGKQKNEAKGELNVSTLVFDDTNDVLHSHVPVTEMKPLTEKEYRIGGCTALLDALGDAIGHAVRHQRHAAPDRRAQNVIFVVITDGLENASKRYTTEDIRKMVSKETKQYGWEFLYLGANIDSFAAAGAIGIDSSRVTNWVADPQGVKTHFQDLEDAVSVMRCCSVAERIALFDTGMWKKRSEEDFKKRGKKR